MKKAIKAALALLLILSLLPFSVSAADDGAVSLCVADGNPVTYTTLEQAMEAAQAELGDSGDYAVLTLLRDVAVAETQEITCNIIISSVWNYDAERGTLSCTSDTTTQYITYQPGTGFGCTEDRDSAACLLLFTDGPELGRCIASQPEAAPYVLEGSGYPAPLYSVSALPQIIEPAAEWSMNGEPWPGATCTLAADSLAGLASGVYPVNCVLSGRDA